MSYIQIFLFVLENKIFKLAIFTKWIHFVTNVKNKIEFAILNVEHYCSIRSFSERIKKIFSLAIVAIIIRKIIWIIVSTSFIDKPWKIDNTYNMQKNLLRDAVWRSIKIIWQRKKSNCSTLLILLIIS
jgi:hypothetical protein